VCTGPHHPQRFNANTVNTQAICKNAFVCRLVSKARQYTAALSGELERGKSRGVAWGSHGGGGFPGKKKSHGTKILTILP
jgi:hypothetical protein